MNTQAATTPPANPPGKTLLAPAPEESPHEFKSVRTFIICRRTREEAEKKFHEIEAAIERVLDQMGFPKTKE